MPSRHVSRRRALQLLYECDLRKVTPADAVADFLRSLYTEETEERPEFDEFMEQLLVGVHGEIAGLDEELVKHSANWKVERMSIVDRNVLRLAIYEMKFLATPSAVIIDEAIELARRFSGDESARFVNGVLDGFRKAAESPKVAAAE